MLYWHKEVMKLKLVTTKGQKILECFCLSILALMIVLTLILWSNAPDIVPAHYNLSGVVDRWGSKNEILILPVIALLLYCLLSVVECFPQIWNIPFTITEHNRIPVLLQMKTMLKVIKIEITIMFSLIMFFSLTGIFMGSVLTSCTILFFATILLFLVRVGKTATKYQ